MTVFSTILNLVAIVATIVNPTNAAPTRGMRAESSLESMADISIIKDEISSRIEASFLDDVLSFTQSSSPTHDSVHGSCVHANNDTELASLISDAQGVGGDGQVRLCPGTIHFHDEIELDDSITLSCSGPRGSCILDGKGATRHFFSNTADLTFTFIGLVLINGFVDDTGFGGSVFLFKSTIIIDGSLFYNNRATSPSSGAVGGAIYAQDAKAVVNNCVFLDNAAVTTSAGKNAFGGAIFTDGELTVVDSIFKNNKAIQADTTVSESGGGAIDAAGDVLVLNSVFELNEASNVGGAALLEDVSSVAWYNNKELLFGNDAGVRCDGANVVGERCFSVGENFSF